MGSCDMMGGGLGMGVMMCTAFIVYSVIGAPIGIGMAIKCLVDGNTKGAKQWAVSAVPLVGPIIAINM
jgi:hypothetical protein